MQQYKLLIASYSNREDGDRFPNMNYVQNKGFLSSSLQYWQLKYQQNWGLNFFKECQPSNYSCWECHTLCGFGTFHCINLTFIGLENAATLVQPERKCNTDKHFISLDGIPDQSASVWILFVSLSGQCSPLSICHMCPFPTPLAILSSAV